jgi:hypothetical protein
MNKLTYRPDTTNSFSGEFVLAAGGRKKKKSYIQIKKNIHSNWSASLAVRAARGERGFRGGSGRGNAGRALA